MLELKRFSASEDLTNAFPILQMEGAVIIEGVISAAGLQQLKTELQPYLDRTSFCEGPFFGTITKRVNALANKSAFIRDMMVNPVTTAIAHRILLPYCSSIQLTIAQAIQIHPHEKSQVLHRDLTMWPLLVSFPYPFEGLVATMWAYDDFTKENGATWVAPGSHKWAKDRRPSLEEIVQAEMKAGSVLIYLGNVIHGGGENKSNKPRTGLLISYCLGWLRQFENFYLESPPNVACKWPKPLRELLGYAVHKPDLGLYEGNDPEILFTGMGGEEKVSKDCMTPEQEALLINLLGSQPNR